MTTTPLSELLQRLDATFTVWLSSEDIARFDAVQGNAPITLDGLPGIWWILDRPAYDMRGRASPVLARLASDKELS